MMNVSRPVIMAVVIIILLNMNGITSSFMEAEIGCACTNLDILWPRKLIITCEKIEIPCIIVIPITAANLLANNTRHVKKAVVIAILFKLKGITSSFMETESASTILDRFVMSPRMNEIMHIKAIIIKSNVGESTMHAMINPRGKQSKNKKIATKTKFILCTVLMLMKVPKNACPNNSSNVILKYRVASFLLTMLYDMFSPIT